MILPPLTLTPPLPLYQHQQAAVIAAVLVTVAVDQKIKKTRQQNYFFCTAIISNSIH